MAIVEVGESNPQAVRRWLEPLVNLLGLSLMIADDLMPYWILAENLGLKHQVYQFYVRRWARRFFKPSSRIRHSRPSAS